MRVFGADAFVFIPKELETKLVPKSMRGIFMGYNVVSKAYRIWLNDKQRITESRDVLFNEYNVIKGLYAESAAERLERVQPNAPILSVGVAPSTLDFWALIIPVGAVTIFQAVAAPAIQPVGANPLPANFPAQAQIDLTPMVNDDSSDPANLEHPGLEEADELGDPEALESELNTYDDLCKDSTLATWEDITLTDADFPTYPPTAPTPRTKDNLATTELTIPTQLATDAIPATPPSIQPEKAEIRGQLPPVTHTPRERHLPSRYGKWIYPENRNFYAGMAKIRESSIPVPTEPKTYLQATKSLHADQWLEAMQQEYNSLIHNGTWSLIDLPAGRNAIHNKWVFKLKMATDGNVARFKAKLVAKGFSQREGIDYSETFSPIVKFDSIRTIMSIAAADNLIVKQFDVETVFLYGDIEEQIYMR
jgi:hypothetical protein